MSFSLSACLVFLAGCSQQCVLSVSAHDSACIPDHALMCITSNPDVCMSLTHSPTSPPPQGEGHKGVCPLEQQVRLPSIAAGESHDTHVTLTVLARKCVYEATGNDEEQKPGPLEAWNHEVSGRLISGRGVG